MIAGIILAGGKGTRLNSVDVNKVTLPFAGKPMIQYGVELLRPFVSELVVVIGAYAESVKEALKDYDVTYAFQEEQKGTGHAVQVALPYLSSHIANVLVGYGDHMMFYKPKTVEKLIQTHVEQHAAITVVTTQVENPFAYGRVLRDEDNNVYGIVEEKAATPQQKNDYRNKRWFLLF
jgi:bifunctional N-acetylglucosamine-1-phosphate-uridyltransferase/glucosamine-1-phosphate-acetyltransferase GlmU-like protein